MITVRTLTKSDIEEVLQIERQCFPVPWSLESFKKEFKNSFARYVVAFIDGQIVGYGGVWLVIDEGHITNIAVREGFRKKGIASEILKSLIKICKNRDITSMTLEVRESNLAARNLYKKHGFMEAGIRPKYYGDNNENALIMWLTF